MVESFLLGFILGFAAVCFLANRYYAKLHAILEVIETKYQTVINLIHSKKV